MNINRVILIGRIAKDIEVRATPTGKSVAKFSVATSEKWKDKDGQKQEMATFHNIVMWGKLADIAGQWLTKGQEVYIEGKISNRKYEAKDGTTKYISEVVANLMQMGAKPKNAVAVDQPANQSIEIPEEEPARTGQTGEIPF